MMPCLPPHLLLQIPTILSMNPQDQWSERGDTHCHLQSGQKKKTPLQDTDSTSDSDKGPDKEQSSGDDSNFQQGMRVLIFYDNQYYVGEVLHTLPDDGDRASIAFMQQVPKQNIFRWGKEDFDTVERKFVMEWDVPMASRNGRTWSL